MHKLYTRLSSPGFLCHQVFYLSPGFYDIIRRLWWRTADYLTRHPISLACCHKQWWWGKRRRWKKRKGV